MKQWLITIFAILILSNCSAAEKGVVEKAQSYTGWYMLHAGEGRFQTCGQQHQMRLTKSADLLARAKDFGLEPDTPVYVRLSGSVRGDAIEVSSVEQFGSPVPVRDCGLTGVVNPTQ